MITILLTLLDFFFVKTFQLASYNLKTYLKEVLRLNFSHGKKTPLKFTKRAKRLFFCDFFAKFATIFCVFWFLHNFWIIFGVIAFQFFFAPILVIIPFVLTLPLEELIKKKYITRAQKKLKTCNCKIVAITGSFGKTSTKEFLTHILQGRFSVCASPMSFNTPMGVCRTILENLSPSDDFLILEFGARHKGDIKTLCKLVGGCDFGIITPLGACHMETFKTAQNLESTKFELCEGTRGAVVFNGKSEGSLRLFERHGGAKILAGVEGSFAYASEEEIGRFGSVFTLVLNGERAKCQCRVLGRANLDNICTAAAMAFILGMSLAEIAEKIATLKPAEHRLELLEGGVVTVIDDSYNSNFDGFCEALDVLSRFPGRKIVISPGIVELGKLQFEINEKIGVRVAEVADIFIIMNETNREALSSGSQNKCELRFAKTREEQKAQLSALELPGDTILFENDLPDNFK